MRTMINDNIESQEDKSSFLHRSCAYCCAPIKMKLFELVEIQRPHNWLSWKRVVVKRWWGVFDAGDPNKRHCCDQHEKAAVDEWRRP